MEKKKKKRKEKKKTTYKPKDFVHFSVIPNLVINNPYVFSPVSRVSNTKELLN